MKLWLQTLFWSFLLGYAAGLILFGWFTWR